MLVDLAIGSENPAGGVYETSINDPRRVSRASILESRGSVTPWCEYPPFLVQGETIHNPLRAKRVRLLLTPVATSAVGKNVALGIQETPIDDSCRVRRAKHLEVGVGTAIGVEYTAVDV